MMAFLPASKNKTFSLIITKYYYHCNINVIIFCQQILSFSTTYCIIDPIIPMGEQDIISLHNSTTISTRGLLVDPITNPPS